MAEKTDREIIKETARIAKRLEKFAKRWFEWTLGTVVLLSCFEILSLFRNTENVGYDNTARFIMLLEWTIIALYIGAGKEN